MSNSNEKGEYFEDLNPFLPRKQLIRSSQFRSRRSKGINTQESPSILPKLPNKLSHAVSLEALPNNLLKPEGHFQSHSQKRLLPHDLRYKSPETVRSSPLELEDQLPLNSKYNGQINLINRHQAPMEKLPSRFDQAYIKDQYLRPNQPIQANNLNKENTPLQEPSRDRVQNNQYYNPKYRRQLDENRGSDYTKWSFKQHQELDQAIIHQIQYKAKLKELDQRQKELDDLKEEERIKREFLELQGTSARQKPKEPSFKEPKEKIIPDVLTGLAPEPSKRLKSLRSPHEPVRKSRFSEMKPTLADENSMEQINETPKFRINNDPNAPGSKPYEDFSKEGIFGKRNPFQINSPPEDLFRYQPYGIPGSFRSFEVQNPSSEQSIFRKNDSLNYEGSKYGKKSNDSPVYLSKLPVESSSANNKLDPLKQISKRFLNAIDQKFINDAPLSKAGAKLVAASNIMAPGGPLYQGYEQFEKTKQLNSPYYIIRKSLNSDLLNQKDAFRGAIRYL